MPYVNTPKGIQLYYESYGKGKPIIFIHPPLMGHVVFRYQKVLSEHAQVILYDQRGHGKSGYQPSLSLDQVIPDHVDDLRALIQGLHLNQPILVGYSSAGLIALAYALSFTDETGGLILSGGFPCVASQILFMEFQVGIFMMKTNGQNILSNLLAKSHKITKEDKRTLYQYGRKANAHAVLDLYKAGLKADYSKQLPQLNQLPMWILYGTRDKFISKHKKYFDPLIKTEIIYIDKAFHQIPMHQYEQFNQVIQRFLSMIDQKVEKKYPEHG
ncbi:alpha/beta fold hydrolase [Sporolactobacillus laevolacticus]|uniref:alpha/beta fold hydrolase n=1 Tax=Sporolactobacillus laevolacticus TaxID=33018 RepID=UPI0025B613B7|nr:alpha/beta hydrolase [Sporolactobacillus laevolacticus]MDN3956070.1 alpha/beta hydrolase [Sporolactobacillus laevolacticus]